MSSAQNSKDDDRLTLFTLRLVIEIVERAAQAAVKESVSVQRKGAVAQPREARRVDGTGLDDHVKLELMVGHDLASTPLLIRQNSTLQFDNWN